MNTQELRTEETGKLDNYAIEPEVDAERAAPRGFAKHAEIISGRWAMIGFVSLLAYQVATRHGLLG